MLFSLQILKTRRMASTTSSLIIPRVTRVQLVDSCGVSVQLANLLLSIHIFANTKNDFILQPFVTDGGGSATIQKEDIMSEVEAHYDSGLMDYVSVEYAMPEVEISVMESSQIQRALNSRTTVWKTLLGGESRRWASIDDLLNIYGGSTNDRVAGRSVFTRWDAERASAQHSLQVELR